MAVAGPAVGLHQDQHPVVDALLAKTPGLAQFEGEVGSGIAAERVHGHDGDPVAGLAGEIHQLVVQVRLLLLVQEVGVLKNKLILIRGFGREARVHFRRGSPHGDRSERKEKQGPQHFHIPKLTSSFSSFTSSRWWGKCSRSCSPSRSTPAHRPSQKRSCLKSSRIRSSTPCQ